MKDLNKNIIKRVKEIIESEAIRSAWSNGVKIYALELLDDLEGANLDGYIDDAITTNNIKELLLNGAESWSSYSWGGSSLIYDCDIAERLCTPSELKRTRNGERRPNANEDWLDTQAMALTQAYHKIRTALYVVSD